MFAVKPPAYFHGNRNYHPQKKYYRKYDGISAPPNRGQNYDLRVIILRHAERIDAILGENWYDQVFGGVSSASAQMYRNPVLPRRLPQRANTLLYVFDPPISRSGQNNSLNKGRELASQGVTIDYCYSSPACRSVLTADAILQGMRQNQVTIRPEPYLFEPLNWNTPLQALGNIPPFLSTGDWINNGFNIDRRYRRLNDYLNPSENEYDFLARSQAFFQSIERRHDSRERARARRSTVLVVGHAASPLIFSNIALQQPFDAELFGKACANVPFLQTTVLERNATNRTWYIRSSTPFV